MDSLSLHRLFLSYIVLLLCHNTAMDLGGSGGEALSTSGGILSFFF